MCLGLGCAFALFVVLARKMENVVAARIGGDVRERERQGEAVIHIS